MTQYVLSLSYGKDSLACLGAIEKLGLPLDRIVHAEVWATDTIPADLPPMVEFKKKADAIIKERWGITVEHIYATKPRERERRSPTSPCSTERSKAESMLEPLRASLSQEQPSHGASTSNSDIKLTYESIFYRTRKSPKGGATESTASRWSRGIGARAISSNGLCNKVDSVLHRGTQSTSLAYGFPISVNRGNWCTALKQRVFRQHPGTRCGDKYCAIPRNSRR